MLRLIFLAAAAIVVLHGLVHLMGFVAYWPLAEVAGLPYKTSLLGQRWPVGPAGMRLYSALWLVAAAGLVVAAVALIAGQSWWLPLLWAAAILSLILAVLDWSNAFRGALISLVILVPLLLVTGLRSQPRPFAHYPAAPPPVFATMSLPADLPAPVARYYQAIMGAGAPAGEVPVIESAVVTARGTVRFAGITFPARLRFTHDAGQGYRHYIEATLFGWPLLKVNETYLDGHARLALPVGVVANEPKVDMAANLGLWGESMWLPSIYFTDPRVRWQAIDDTTARLIVPSADGEDSFTVFFDAGTGLIRRMEALRYREASDEEKIPWQLDILAWDDFHGILIPSLSSATWADEGSPWLVVQLDEVAYNVDVAGTIRAEGP